MDLDHLSSALKLQPLEGEGGLWAPIYRDSASNAIYFAMKNPDFSAWHKIPEPELWIHIHGAPTELFTIESGTLQRRILSHSSESSTYRVPSDTWMAARPLGDWSLQVCALTPAFSAMTLAKREELISAFPAITELPDLFHE
ncbi:MAG: hypothetical protein EB054_04745 [Actinobacteria bacterium]|jgi:predicted cupin superfamily sugar epimerase|nr:hypothetical protein [Actinomycetota bacterium]